MEIVYRITELDETKYSFNYEADYRSVNRDELVFQLSHSIETDAAAGTVSVGIATRIVDPQGTALAEEAARATFAVTPFAEFVAPGSADDELQIQAPAVMDTFVHITIGAVRGMLAKNLKGTPLQGCVFPLIPMEELRKRLTKKNEG